MIISATDPHQHQAAHNHFADHDYDVTLREMQSSFSEAIKLGPIFRTDATGLFDIYLDNLPIANAAERQYHNCNTCRRFIESFGGLVTVNYDGFLVPIMWLNMAAGYYGKVVNALYEHVSKAKIISVFASNEPVWGTPETGDWKHFAIRAPREILHRGFNTPGQAMAASVERRRIVIDGLVDFKPKLLDEALRVLKADAVAGADKFVAPIQWLRDLHDRPKGPRGDNLLWKAIALAPEGYCHPRAAVTGTLLEDIAAGMSFDDIQRRFNAKMHPLQYQRPQAAPSAGTLLQAEKLVEQMGIAKSLERRFARIDEVRKLWEPQRDPQHRPTGGIFAHLKAKDSVEGQTIALPMKSMTWEKFAEKVLPTTHRLQALIPRHGNFMAMVTAEHYDAHPILKWDREDDRYPVSVYLYHGGSTASNWGLWSGQFVDVTAIAPIPTVADNVSGGAVLIIDGAKDQNTGQGIALFPETLRTELHGIRSVIEAYSLRAKLGGREEASANGLCVGKGSLDIRLRAFDGSGWSDYRIDRWE